MIEVTLLKWKVLPWRHPKQRKIKGNELIFYCFQTRCIYIASNIADFVPIPVLDTLGPYEQELFIWNKQTKNKQTKKQTKNLKKTERLKL